MKIESTEALFKMALENKQYADVMRMVHHSRLCGQAIIAYLQQKGFPEVRILSPLDKKTVLKDTVHSRVSIPCVRLPFSGGVTLCERFQDSVSVGVGMREH